ncbi:GNAT family N-acetyltransferase [Brevibacillus marinus]|uniref:GNAT family N-acetyltransferase n=1 Tax=Brevibacillus marinus TaxID=2496837 RepID=UPI000F817793|nr:GNAT family protein [Brevibacillus marinus]
MKPYMGENIYIRFIKESDAYSLLSLFQRNQDFFNQHSPVKKDYSDYTLKKQRNIIRKWQKEREADKLYSFGIFLIGTQELIGHISLRAVKRGPLQSCEIGYVLDQHHNGKGYMTEAIRLVVDFAFFELQLHRIVAEVMPANIGSIRALEKAGFQREGIARKLLLMDGEWEDHVVLSILPDDLAH